MDPLQDVVLEVCFLGIERDVCSSKVLSTEFSHLDHAFVFKICNLKQVLRASAFSRSQSPDHSLLLNRLLLQPSILDFFMENWEYL